MAQKINPWLKVLIGFILTLIVLILSSGAVVSSRKLDKNVFELHEKYQGEQFTDIKDSLKRIEEKL